VRKIGNKWIMNGKCDRRSGLMGFEEKGDMRGGL